MKEKVIISFAQPSKGLDVDIEVPLHISANELINALNTGFKLGIDTNDVTKCHLVCENPTALLIGDDTLKDLGLRDGSRVICKIN